MLEGQRKALQQLDDLIDRRKREGRLLDAIQLSESALELRVKVFGAESFHVQSACRDLSDSLNAAALKRLQTEEMDTALELLRKAEVLTGPDDLVTAVTYNNLACYYRRRGRLRTALQYLNKALKIESKSQVVVNPAGTRLNLCAVLSQLGRHEAALEHAQAAVILLQEDLVAQASAARMSLSLDSSPELLNKMAVLAISYHNMGVEQEYLHKPKAALEAYQKAVDIAAYYLGEDNEIMTTLHKSLEAAQAQAAAAENRQARARRPGSAMASSTRNWGGPYDAIMSSRKPSSGASAMSMGSRPVSAMTTRSSRRPGSAVPKGFNQSQASPAPRPISAVATRDPSSTWGVSSGLPPRPVSAFPTLGREATVPQAVPADFEGMEHMANRPAQRLPGQAGGAPAPALRPSSASLSQTRARSAGLSSAAMASPSLAGSLGAASSMGMSQHSSRGASGLVSSGQHPLDGRGLEEHLRDIYSGDGGVLLD